MAQETLVQVTPNAIRLVDANELTLLQELPVTKNITVATGNTEQLIVSLSGGEVSYFQLNTQTRKLDLISTVQLDQDVACISVRTISEALRQSSDTSGHMDVDGNSSSQTILALGMWTDNTVRLFTLPTLTEITRLSLGTDTQSRDILIEILENVVYLFIGMGDGILITYTMDFSLLPQGGLPQLINKRTGVLGTHPITFTSFLNNEERCIFACCDRPTVIYMRHKKLLFSVLDIRSSEIIGMTSFHAELFPDCLALCSETSLIIGTVEDIQKLHVQTIPLDEAPRRIAYSSENSTYAGNYF
jgi:DNA damage-binding protein 1